MFARLFAVGRNEGGQRNQIDLMPGDVLRCRGRFDEIARRDIMGAAPV